MQKEIHTMERQTISQSFDYDALDEETRLFLQ